MSLKLSDEPMFSTADVMRETGATRRQLQWWCDEGLLPYDTPQGTRRFAPEAIVRVRLILEARRFGLAKKRLRAVLRAVDRSTVARPFYLLIESGRPIETRCLATEVVEALKAARGGMLLVTVPA